MESGRAARNRRWRILIAGINFPPETAGIAPYTAGMAEHLAAYGLNVTVLAGMPSYPRWRVFPGYEQRWWLHERRGDLSIYRLRHVVPAQPSAAGRGLYEATFLLHGLRGLVLPRPDLVIGVVPAVADGVLARLLSARFGVPYGLLFQDLVGPAARQSGTRGGSTIAGVARVAEGWAARGATAVGAISPGFLPYLRSLGVTESRLVHVPNWTHVQAPRGDRCTTRAAMGWRNGEQIVLHAGNMGVKQALEQVIAAARLANLRDEPLHFVFLGDGNQRPDLERQARGLANCTFLDPVPGECFSDLLAAADVLLVSERASVREMSLPSKLTSYFAAGRPVVAMSPADGLTAAEIRRSGGGLATPPESPLKLLALLASLRSDMSLAGRLGRAGQHYAATELGADAALHRVERFVERIAGRRLFAQSAAREAS